MKLVTNLLFDGCCREAFEHYAKALDGRIVQMVRFGDVPEEASFAKGFEDTIMFAWLEAQGQVLMGGDAPPQSRRQPQGFTVAIHLEDPEKGQRIFDALAAGGTVGSPFGATFFSSGYGAFTDRFGIPWTVNCGSLPS